MPDLSPETDVQYTSDVSVIASESGLRSIGITTDNSKFSAVNGQKIIYPGTPIGRIIGSPRGRAFTTKIKTAAVTTSSTAIAVEDASIFVPGDELVVTAGYARIDIALAWANNDTLQVTMGGITVTHTVSNYSTLTALATAIATTLNNSPLAQLADFVASLQAVHVFGKPGVAIAVAETTAGDGAATINGSHTQLTAGQSVEVVASVDVAANTINTVGNVDRALPVGAPIGVQVAEVVGITLSPFNLLEDTNDVGVYDSARVYKARLRGWNKAIAASLPEIRFAY